MGIEGKHILSTRDANSNDEFESVLISHGAIIECFPTIKIIPAENNVKLDEVLRKVNSYDGIFFTSSNGVRNFFERAKELGIRFENKIYGVGDKTGLSIKKYGYTPDFIPENFSSDSIADEMKPEELKNKKFLLPRGNLSQDNLKNKLEKFAQVDDIVVYQTICPVYGTPYIEWLKDILDSEGLDCLTFFSPSAIQNFYKLLGKIEISKTDIAVIGKTTMTKAQEFGLNVNVIPDKSTSENLAKAIVEYYEKMN